MPLNEFRREAAESANKNLLRKSIPRTWKENWWKFM